MYFQGPETVCSSNKLISDLCKKKYVVCNECNQRVFERRVALNNNMVALNNNEKMAVHQITPEMYGNLRRYTPIQVMHAASGFII